MHTSLELPLLIPDTVCSVDLPLLTWAVILLWPQLPASYLQALISMSGIGGRVPELLNLHANVSTSQVLVIAAYHQRALPYLDMPLIII